MFGRKSKNGLKKIGVILLLLLAVSLPLFSQDYVQVEKQDWIQITNFVNQQKEELPKLQVQLTTLQEELSQQKILSQTLKIELTQANSELEKANLQLSSSLETLNILKESQKNTEKEINALQIKNTVLKISLGVSVGVALGAITYLVINNVFNK